MKPCVGRSKCDLASDLAGTLFVACDQIAGSSHSIRIPLFDSMKPFRYHPFDLELSAVSQNRPLMGSAHETEKIVRLGLPRIIRLKENAPELDTARFM